MEGCGRKGGCCKVHICKPLMSNTYGTMWLYEWHFSNFVFKSNLFKEKGNAGGCDLTEEDDSQELFQTSEFVPYDASQEPLFPPELIASAKLDEQFLTFRFISNTTILN